MKKICMSLFLLFGLLSFASAQQGTEAPLGIWTNESQEARFEIYKCGDKLCGKIVWLREPNRDGKPKTDTKNPDPKLRDRPLVGLVFMKGFEYDEKGKWDDGTIYDPQNGKTYSCFMQVLGKDKLEVKGYIGISVIGRSQIWTRVK